MVLRVRPTPTRFPIYNLYTTFDNSNLHSILSVRNLWGKQLTCRTKSTDFALVSRKSHRLFFVKLSTQLKDLY